MQSNTAAVEKQGVNFTNSSVENRKPDLFTIVDGRYVGHDGFIVPKNFWEFHERFPEYVRHWVNRHVDRSTPTEDVEDWTQDLLIHLHFLPVTSKHRDAGKEDIVQTFDPVKHHGANGARFFNYINLCLQNKFRSMRSKRLKNPLCRPGNLSLTAHWEGTDQDQVGDEFCHAHSDFLRKRCHRQEKQQEDRAFILEFAHFVEQEDSAMLPVIETITKAATQPQAAHLQCVAKVESCRSRERLRTLARRFLSGDPVPRPRRRYRMRLERCAKTLEGN